MSAQSQLETYLREFRERLSRLIVARGAAILGIAALAVTLIAVYFGTRRAFDPEFVFGARLVLLFVIVGIVIGLLFLPLKALRRSRGIGEIERRAPVFDGRIETYDGLVRAPKRSAFLSLLAEDAISFAKRLPAAIAVPAREISIPAAIGVLAAGALVWFAAVGPDNWRYGVRHLWAGWIIDNTLPPQRIAVTPGDGAVRRGGDLKVEAIAEGFDPATMEVFALFQANGDWQNATMYGVDDTFEFTFFSVRDPLRYYVSAAGVRSQEFSIDVVDLPDITQLKLTYDYPDWTELDARIEDPGNDIRAVEGTQVTVEIETDRPLGSTTLVANGAVTTMQTEGNLSTATLTVSEDGEYHIATLINDDSVQLSDDYFITVVPDNEPVVKVVQPGRDWRASAIEEVAIAVEATDDFGLNTVELRYSVNGGEWETVALETEATASNDEAVLYLEDMRQPVVRREPPAATEIDFSRPLTLEDLRRLRAEIDGDSADESTDPAAADQPPVPTDRALEPGDLISYYAFAEDRGQSVQTDMFFVEVQPFDRRFTQAQAGGGGGGGGQQQQDEISRRQKEIIVATWNLIRERDEEEESFLDEQQLNDNALMLAELQRTLAEQAETLANRTRARQLTGVDPRIEAFVEI